MASSSSAADEPSAAQQLMHIHQHQATVEDVPDEDDVKHDAALGGASAGTTASSSAANAAAEASAPAPSTAPAPSWAPTPSAKAAGKQKAAAPEPGVKLDTQSHELFPELGGPKKTTAHVTPIWGAKPSAAAAANGKKPNGSAAAAFSAASETSNGASGASTPVSSAAATPASPAFTPANSNGPPPVSIPGRNFETILLDDHHFLPRQQLKRPLPDIIKDFNRRSRANISIVPAGAGRKRVNASGPRDVAQQALKDFVQQIGTKQSVKVAIPKSVRPHIIGKSGATIKAIQESTGARIQLPKADEVAQASKTGLYEDDDDDVPIYVTIEGNALSAAMAEEKIQKIVSERAANVNTRVRGVPAEIFPFIADPKNGLVSNLENSGVQVTIPPLQPWSAAPPTISAENNGRPVFAPAADRHIQLAGDRIAVQNARAQIEKLAGELQENLKAQQATIPKGRQQFIIGDHGTPAEDFFNETGCALVLPTGDEDDNVIIIGPSDAVDAGLDRVLDLAMGMQCSNYDISRFHRQVPGGAAAHARNVTRYLRERKEIERIEKAYQSHINTPFTDEGALPWELYSRDGKNAIRAQTEIKNIVSSHPPSRMATVPVDPFYHAFLRKDVGPRVQENHGVFLVVPDAASEPGAPVLLVYEGLDNPEAAYTIPQSAPSAAEVAIFEQGVRDAQQHIMDLLKGQEEIQSISLEIPLKFHDRLRRYIKEQQESRQSGQPPVRVSNHGTTVTLRGPKTLVETLAAKVTAFIEQEKEDEKERGFTLSFDFPKAYANHLIGKGGSNIRELRDKFDVEIQVQDGKVELKGPKAKAEAAKTHINAVARHLADEVTHVVKIEPKFHRELIGAQGSTIGRLQERYNVLIFFPRVAKSPRDDESVTDTASETGKGSNRRQQAPDEVIIRGPKKGADGAREELMTLYLYNKENSFTSSITVQQKQVPYLIGQGGQAMEALRQETGAKIDVPNSRGDPDSLVEINIKGTQAQVKAAKKTLEEKKAILDDTIVKTIEVDKKYHKALIGSGGSNIREMVAKAGVTEERRDHQRTVQFPSQESNVNTIRVEGRRAVVERLISQINEYVQERESQVTEVIDVAKDKHRALIGRGGDTRRQIESQFSVVLDIPRQGQDKTDVKLTGLPANVEKAKEHILNLVKDQHSVTVQVPRRVHHAVSNKGQFFRRMRSEHGVTIDHAGQPVPPKPTPQSTGPVNGNGELPLITDEDDLPAGGHSWSVADFTSSEEGDIPWVLRGEPDNVEKVKAALEKAVAEAEKGRVVGYLRLSDPRNFRHVIGSQGSTISAIRKSSGCRINVPLSRSGDEAIEVVGTKDGVEAAKELILEAVKAGGSAGKYE